MATWTRTFTSGSYAGNWIARLDYTVNWQNVTTNQSNISLNLYVYSTGSAYTQWGTFDGRIYVNGGQVASWSGNKNVGTSPTWLAGWSGTLTHDANGNLWISIGDYINAPVNEAGYSAIGWTLPRIPLAPSIAGTSADTIKDTSARLGVEINNVGHGTSSAMRMYYRKQGASSWTATSTQNDVAGWNYWNVTGLTQNSTYEYYASVWNNNGDTSSSSVKTFKTLVSLSADFSVTSNTVMRNTAVAFTNLSVDATSYSWNFGDGSTSTATNPTHTYSSAGNYTVTLTATNSTGSKTKSLILTIIIKTFTYSISVHSSPDTTMSRQMTFYRSVDASSTIGSSLFVIVQKQTGAIPEKKYLYKTYDESGVFLGILNYIADDPEFSQEINSLGSTMTLTYAPEITATNTGSTLIQHNNRVDVYSYYGTMENLQAETGEEIQAEDGDFIQLNKGFPNGIRIFTGFISDINIRYGSEESTLLTLSSYGWDLNHFPLISAGNTTVTYNSYDPSNIALDVMAKFGAESVDYSLYTTANATSVETTGTVVSYTFRNNTYAEVLDKVLELSPSNWYYYIGLGDNILYIKERGITPDHLFYLGKHIISLDLKSNTSQTVNDVIFTGGGDPALFKRYTETRAARTRRTLKRYADNRVTVEASAQVISEGLIDRLNRIQYRSTIEIASRQYDIETINVGDMIGFRNFGNSIDQLIMQVVGLSYQPDKVQLQLDSLPPTVNKRLEDIRRNLTVTENQNTPTAPS